MTCELAMRVTGGKYRGLTLSGPSHQGLRPTTDLVRAALFNILGPTLEGARVLDLFAGSGALGIEALSRGAGAVSLVEQDPRGLHLLKQNLQRLRDVTAEVRVFPADVFRILPKFGRKGLQFDLILIDPPYHANLWLTVLELISRHTLLAPGGRIVLEIAKQAELPPAAGDLRRVDKRFYGDVSLEFWQNKTDGADE